MSDFAPSIEAARKALGKSIAIDTKVHPAGAKGVALSLDEVALRVKRGRNDPRVRAWAIRAVKDGDAGGVGRFTAKAEAILKALKKTAVYVLDPLNTEFIQAAHETLCLDDKGLCFKGGDCDDLTVAYGSAVMSIGIPFKVIGQSFKGGKVPTHVMGAIQDNETKEWLRVDPSTDKPVGDYVLASKEWWIDPLDEKDMTTAQIAGAGDFIGVGGFLGDVPEPTQNIVVQQIQAALYSMQTSVTNLEAALDQVANITSVAGFDPEPSINIEGISDFPQNGIWTPTMDTIARQYLSQVQYLVSVGQDALSGARTIYLDASNNVLIQQLAVDAYTWNPVAVGTDLIIAIYDKAGSLLGGITSAIGEYLNPSQVEAKAPSAATNTVQGLGVVPVAVWVAGVAVVVVDFILVYAVMAKLADMVTAVAREKSRQDLIAFYAKCVADKTCNADQATAALNANQELMNQAARDNAKDNPFRDILDEAAQVLKWVAIGGLVVVGGYVAYPVLRELSVSAAGAIKSKREGA